MKKAWRTLNSERTSTLECSVQIKNEFSPFMRCDDRVLRKNKWRDLSHGSAWEKETLDYGIWIYFWIEKIWIPLKKSLYSNVCMHSSIFMQWEKNVSLYRHENNLLAAHFFQSYNICLCDFPRQDHTTFTIETFIFDFFFLSLCFLQMKFLFSFGIQIAMFSNSTQWHVISGFETKYFDRLNSATLMYFSNDKS